MNLNLLLMHDACRWKTDVHRNWRFGFDTHLLRITRVSTTPTVIGPRIEQSLQVRQGTSVATSWCISTCLIFLP
jgi:hypothetical protein